MANIATLAVEIFVAWLFLIAAYSRPGNRAIVGDARGRVMAFNVPTDLRLSNISPTA